MTTSQPKRPAMLLRHPGIPRSTV